MVTVDSSQQSVHPEVAWGITQPEILSTFKGEKRKFGSKGDGAGDCIEWALGLEYVICQDNLTPPHGILLPQKYRPVVMQLGLTVKKRMETYLNNSMRSPDVSFRPDGMKGSPLRSREATIG